MLLKQTQSDTKWTNPWGRVIPQRNLFLQVRFSFNLEVRHLALDQQTRARHQFIMPDLIEAWRSCYERHPGIYSSIFWVRKVKLRHRRMGPKESVRP